jgi:hypothetical protein
VCERGKPIAEWVVPAPPVVQSNYISSSAQEPLLLTCAAAQDNYVITGDRYISLCLCT